MVTEAIPSTPQRHRTNATTREFPIQRLPCGDPDCLCCYPYHAERGQVARFGLRDWQQLAREADAAIAGL